jgi:hypothetical protein
MSTPAPATDLATFRAQLDIVGLAGKLTEVAPTGGRGGKIRCPFHEEGSASCYLYPEDNHFHCFGCGAHGSVMDLVAQLRGVGFGEAIEWCAETSGIPAPARDPREAARAAGLRAVRTACAEGRADWKIDLSLAEKLGLGRGHDLAAITAPLARSPLRADEAQAFEGTASIELHHRSGVTGVGFFADTRDAVIDPATLGPLAVASGSGRPALVALGAARDTVREEYLVLTPTAADAIRLQVAGVRGAVAPAGVLDLATAQLLASLVPELILAVASGTPADEAVETLTLLARAGLRARLAAMRPDAIGTPVPAAAYLARLAAKIEGRPGRDALLGRWLDALPSPSTRALYEADFRSKGLL